jgi:glycosyltransferase involved in cell wall biosynthesis
MLTGRDIVCLSTQDWDGLWTRKQRFMKMFAENGNRVLYIETPVHLLGLDVLPHDPLRFFRFLKGPRQVQQRLYVGTLPILLPMFQMFRFVNSINQAIVTMVLRSWIRKLGLKNPLLWIYTPFSAKVVDGIPHAAAVYECVDEFRAARGLVRSSVVGGMEDELLRRVQLAVVTQENLLAHRASICSNTVCIPNGADVRQFGEAVLGHAPEPSDIAAIPRPRFGFVGHIHYWIDLKLMRFLAEQKPEWSFVLVGPTHPLARTQEVRHLSNVHMLGRKPQEQIPAYVNAMDVCLNPYIPGLLADHVSPLKLYEYLAGGKPVVSTDMPECRKFSEFVRIVNSHEAFLAECAAAIGGLPEAEAVVRKRLDAVQEHSWENRFQTLNGILSKLLA